MLIGRIARGHRIEALNCAFQILTRAASGVRKRGGTKIGDRSELVKRIIEENFSEPGFNVDRLAEIMGCGRVVLSREFSQRFGVTLSGYIRSLRIRKALEMLEKYETDIAEIAVECGYSSAGYFSKSLVAATGQTPSEFRTLKRH